MNVAPLFSVLYIVGYYLLLYGKTNNVVKRRAALSFVACQSKKVLPAWFASFDADIRIGRRRCPHRSTQMILREVLRCIMAPPPSTIQSSKSF